MPRQSSRSHGLNAGRETSDATPRFAAYGFLATGVCGPTTHPRRRPWLAFAKELGAVKTVNAAKDEPLDDAGDVLASMDSFATVGVTVIDRY